MGVPALFRWLSKKYPKIVSRVVEDTPTKVRNQDAEITEVPIRYESKNPNGFEVDNLYLDMNGIVHPCTHPEGKPAPETEEEMMVEIFKYTERVVNMARPRKVLMMAIDGVAPRAKMNQQRSRRFRAAQEAADKEEERKEAIELFEAMGHPVSEETRNQKTWDTNAITPGTPFMDLLSTSLKYWVSHKLTTDPGWRDLKIIISDSSVPGEGEHKIVDWIRRQRTHSTWDPNTSHVIYGLDADLIMLGLATHEPHFRVLREDVFAQGSKRSMACKNCGEEGHFAANCKGQKKLPDPKVVEKAETVDPKPFIFLDVSVLREYLAVELNVSQIPFPFDLELAIDDWIFMIFFVGNDFLPHLPSLEIREGAIDVLLKIWKSELPRMGGYLTNHGKVNLERAQVILEGLAQSEDEIFQKRKEDEDRQEQRQKQRRTDDHRRQDQAKAAKDAAQNGTTVLNGQEYVAVTPAATARGGAMHPSLPSRPSFDLVPKDEVVSGAPASKKRLTEHERDKLAYMPGPDAIPALQGSNLDAVNNRKEIRMANMSAAERLRAELSGDTGDADEPEAAADKDDTPSIAADAPNVSVAEENPADLSAMETDPAEAADEGVVAPADDNINEDEGPAADEAPISSSNGSRGKKRKADEDDEDADGSDVEAPPNPEADQPVPKKKLKVNPDGTVEGYFDDVRLWEPGYRERYYEQKFGVPLSDTDFISKVTRSYMEGLCWVLEYYYQGVPAWDWYYPYHYAPFAQDFKDIGKLDISFEVHKPFKPFAQLLGVFPAASRKHLPEPLQTLMTHEDSPIIDFYPDDFEIDMNGKKMAWQGVALLPFIDQTRLLDALESKEELFTDDEKRRNRWGDNVMFIADGNALYDAFCSLYTLKAGQKPIQIDVKASQGTSGAVLADPGCVPNSALESPLPSIPECPDLDNNSAISVRYYFPRQMHSHRSVILRGYQPEPPRLTEGDKDWVRRGGQRGGGGGGGGGYGGGGRGPRYSGGQQMGGPGMSHGGNNGRNYPDPGRTAAYGVHPGPPQGGYGGGGYAPPPIPAGGGYGGYGYGGGNPYAAVPPNPYGHGMPQPTLPYRSGPPAPYGAPPVNNGYGGGYGGNGGAYNPYGAAPPPRNGPPPRRR